MAYFWREDAPHSRELKNVLLLIYTSLQKLRMHKHRLAQAGLFSHLPPPRLYKDTFCHDPKIQNQRGILLTIYVGISSTLYPGIRQGCLCNERYIIARKKDDQKFSALNMINAEKKLLQDNFNEYCIICECIKIHHICILYISEAKL